VQEGLPIETTLRARSRVALLTAGLVAAFALVEADRPGTYVVPSRIDPNVNTVVDISIEPRDGDEAHSGDSILRGELQA